MTSCPVCDRPTTTTRVPESAAAVGPVTARLLGLPTRRCEAGHVHVDDGHVDAIVARAARDAPAATTTLVRRRERCASCEAELVLPPRHSEKPVPAPIGDVVVTVLLEAPWSRCAECGTEQLAPGIGDDRRDAAIRAAAHHATEAASG